MSIEQMNQPSRKPLRLWPGIAAAVLTLFRFLVPVVAPDAAFNDLPISVLAMLGGVLGGVIVLVWWLVFSRAPWVERIGAFALMAVTLFATSYLVDPSIAGGMQHMMLPFYSIPVLGLALVIAVVATRHRTTGARRAAVAVAIVLACGVFTLIRTGGLIGAGSDIHWRWTPTPEERLLARASDEPVPPPPANAEIPSPTPSAPSPRVEAPKDAPATTPVTPPPAKTEPVASAATHVHAEWPGFRGPQRDGVVHGVRIETDWSKSPPVQLWRQPIGPGWSSFAVAGDRIYTQEQRGEDELVASYSLTTGKPVWRHRDHVRFYESNGGAGPRGTPTLSGDRVYAMGAT